MAQTKFAVIYSTNTKIVRSIFLPDDDSDLDGHPLHPQESMQVESLDEFQASGQHIHDYAKSRVEAVTGASPADDRCLVVDKSTGTVVDVIHADHTWEVHPDPTKMLVKA